MSNNDEARMTNDETSSNVQMTNKQLTASSSFGFRPSFVIRNWSFVVFLAFALSLYAAPPPSAREILDSVRLLESRQQIDLDGQLREEEKVIPFHLAQTGPLIRYSFSDPEEVLQLRLGGNGSRLDLVTDAGAEKFPAEKLNEKIRGTGISYEDLALKFLYWENVLVLGDETVRRRRCWKFQVVTPYLEPQYLDVLI